MIALAISIPIFTILAIGMKKNPVFASLSVLLLFLLSTCSFFSLGAILFYVYKQKRQKNKQHMIELKIRAKKNSSLF